MEFAVNRSRLPARACLATELITPTNPCVNTNREDFSILAASLLNVLWISLGAVVGANARYFLSRWVARNFTANFPYGTLLINITGSLILGFFMAWTTERVLADPRWRLLVAIGFC